MTSPNFIKDSFDRANKFVKVVFQRGKEVIDFELNELQDDIRVPVYFTMNKGVQTTKFGTEMNPGSNDDGFLVVGTSAANQVTISAGNLFCDGQWLELLTPFTLTGFTTPPGNRTDVVYLAVTEVYVADPATEPKIGETTQRRQLQYTYGISITGLGGVPANSVAEIYQGGVHYFPIASIARFTGVATIAPGDVTDLRYLLPPSILSEITRQSAGVVQALQASVLETPDGSHGQAKSGLLYIEIDPDNTQANPNGIRVRLHRDSTPSFLFDVLQDAFDSPFAITRRAEIGTGGAAYGTTSTVLGFYDANTVANATANGSKVVPLGSATASKGDSMMRVFDEGYGTQSLTPASILQRGNAKWVCTVGDGTSSFGDFNGVDAVKQARDFAVTAGLTAFVIQVKRGTFTSATLAVPASTTVEIEGIEDGAIIDVATSGNTISVGSASVLVLRKIRVNANSAAYAVSAVDSKQVRFYESNVASCYFQDVGHGTTATTPVAVIAESTKFFESTKPTITVEGGAGAFTYLGRILLSHCTFDSTGYTPISIRSASTVVNPAGTVFEGVLANGCKFNLGSTTIFTSGKTAGVLTSNTGLIDLDPNGIDNRATGVSLSIQSCVFDDCDIWAMASSSTSADNVFIHLLGTANGTNNASSGAFLDIIDLTFSKCRMRGRLNQYISGGGPYSTGVNLFTVVAARQCNILDCHWNSYQNGTADGAHGFMTDDLQFDLGQSSFVAYGGLFTFLGTGKLVVRNFVTENMQQSSGITDVRIHMNDVDIDGWKLTYTPITFTGGTRPFARFLMTAKSTTSKAVVKNVTFVGATTVSNDWFSGTPSGMLYVSNYTGGGGFQFPVKIEKIVIRDFTDSGGVTTQINGILIEDGTDSAGTTGLSAASAVAGVQVRDSFIRRTRRGVYVRVGSAHTVTQVDVVDCDITECTDEGIFYEAGSGTMIMQSPGPRIVGCTIVSCTGYAMHIHADLSAAGVAIQNNCMLGNNGGGTNDQMYIQSTTTNTRFYLYGNRTEGGKIKIAVNGSSALSNPVALVQTTTAYWGAETGINATGSAPALNFVSGDVMLHNQAILTTP